MKNHKELGFGLIEVLVALAILAVGLMSLASFQSGLISSSSESHAKSQALMLAQSRMESIRNYTEEGLSETEFETFLNKFPDDRFPKSTETGVSTQYKISQKLEVVDATNWVTVTVAWVDPVSGDDSIQLQSAFTWLSPGLAGEVDNTQPTGEYIRSATGRAKLGEGQINADDDVNTSINGDGTGLVNRGDGDLLLTSGQDIVLTLEDACEIDNDQISFENCTGFVEISGRVFKDSSNTGNKDVDLANAYVIASDAAFCQRYYVSGSDLVVVDGLTEYFPVISGTSVQYFDYTCYLGGGWHGNVGILDGGTREQQTAIIDACLGDPYSSDTNFSTKVASRRVYRGMAYNAQNNGRPEVNEAELPIYYSIGVSDALILPETADTPHHFFLANSVSPTEEECASQMVEANIENELSAMPTDFFCLNQNENYLDKTKIDSYGYTFDDYCPYDPSDPPAKEHQITGSVYVKGENLVAEELLNSLDVNTSDGHGNCSLTYNSVHEMIHLLDFSCNVYDWDREGDSGWQGTINLSTTNSELLCTSYQRTFIDADTVYAGVEITDDFLCGVGVDPGEGNGDEPVTYSITVTGNVLEGTADNKYGGMSFVINRGATEDCTGRFSCIGTSEEMPWSGSITVRGQGRDVCVGMPENVTSEQFMITSGTNGGSETIVVQLTNLELTLLEFNVAILGSNESNCNNYAL